MHRMLPPSAVACSHPATGKVRHLVGVSVPTGQRWAWSQRPGKFTPLESDQSRNATVLLVEPCTPSLLSIFGKMPPRPGVCLCDSCINGTVVLLPLITQMRAIRVMASDHPSTAASLRKSPNLISTRVNQTHASL